MKLELGKRYKVTGSDGGWFYITVIEYIGDNWYKVDADTLGKEMFLNLNQVIHIEAI